jgi:hypothetical protein
MHRLMIAVRPIRTLLRYHFRGNNHQNNSVTALVHVYDLTHTIESSQLPQEERPKVHPPPVPDTRLKLINIQNL